MNSTGQLYRLTTWGESHGPAVGGVIDGVPAGIAVDFDLIQHQLDRRRPGQSAIVTARDEADRLEVLSGVYEGFTTGAPLAFMVRNSDMHSADYDNMRDIYRASHADYTYDVKSRGHRDPRGGGRSSARVTLPVVVAGALAAQILAKDNIRAWAYTRAVGEIAMERPYTAVDPAMIDTNAVRCPDSETARRMEELILSVKADGDTVGGVVECVVTGLCPGLGEPVFDKLHARLARAMMGINAAKGFEYGMGFEGACCRGSQVNDRWVSDPDDPRGMHAATNHSGGIQGGITNGEPVVFRVAFKPVATMLGTVTTLDRRGHEVTLKARGRHDPCVVPRAVPIVESLASMVVLDAMMLDKARR